MYGDPGQLRIFFKITVPDDYLLHLTGRQDPFFLTGYQLTIVGDAEIVVLQDAIYAETDEGLFTGFVRADLRWNGVAHMGARFYRDGCCSPPASGLPLCWLFSPPAPAPGPPL